MYFDLQWKAGTELSHEPLLPIFNILQIFKAVDLFFMYLYSSLHR